MNNIVSFLLNNSAPCGNWICTTCGGLSHFLERLHKAFPKDDDLAENLKALNGSDIRHKITNHRNCMPQVLNSLPEEIRKTVFEVWVKNTKNDPDLALAVLLWTEHGKSLSYDMMHELLQSAETRFVRSRKLRDNLRKSLLPETELPLHLQSVIEKDMREEEENRKRAYNATKERNDYLNDLSDMSFNERVPRILSDQSIKYSDWREAWSLCADADLEMLDVPEVQKLIDLCQTNQSYRWTEALKKLYDKRHQLSCVAIEMFRQQCGHLNPHEQLLLLIGNCGVPIEHYPAELAQYVTLQWLDTLTQEKQKYFLELLHHTRLRVWKKVREKIRNGNQNA